MAIESQKIEIRSHLTKQNWKKSWSDKVVEDTRENTRQYHKTNCFYGHFENDSDFILYHHKEFEGTMLTTFFMGHVEKTEEGCRITGHFSKRKTANIFFIFAAVLTLIVAIVMSFAGQIQMAIAPFFLCIIVIMCYFVMPSTAKDRLTNQLKKISFDDQY